MSRGCSIKHYKLDLVEFKLIKILYLITLFKLKKIIMKLMKNEEPISLNCPGLILTNMRLRSEVAKWGKIQIKSVMLEDICHSELDYKSNPKLLIIAFLTLAIGGAIGGAVGGMEDETVGGAIAFMGFVAACILVLIYLFTRRHIIHFSSSKNNIPANITIRTKGLHHDDIKSIIDTVEEAKNERIMSLKQ